ncbi:HIT-like domain-containing protein [Rhodocollybia butyracea]|uniref:HIT-like domain-containing protein n=1 Tax=Rhodocollybia butyracea TaxID=206335 RepID=A0A9P5PZ87_9AGAR|nr:HIT-like domain-containing protein [Rhodocollybia butyracea]
MTSFIIKSHVQRPPHSWKQDSGCAFCRIINNESPSKRVFENDKVVAFLDIMPLRKGHTLVIPKVHYSRLSELPPDYAAAVGEAVSKVAHALTQALGNTALNVVCNQEYAQAVPHVHYHIIPAPNYASPAPTVSPDEEPPLTLRQMHKLEFEGRDELDDDDAVLLVKSIRARL